MSDVYLTKEGYEKLKEELARLNDEKAEIAREVEETRAQGDLKENAGYHAAKERHGMVLNRIHELQTRLHTAKLVDNLEINKDHIRLGATVTMVDEASRNQSVYTLGSADEADPGQGRISVSSPLAQGLLGAKAGEKVRVKLPSGEKVLSILKVEYK
ncbi:MAG: transcription elongation factor GreA [Elusimicrobiales bacterium]|jgi:transcription elongation factor GreA